MKPRRQARFIAGAARLRDLPGTGVAEVAFGGRSNVGKSSLINAILGSRGVARVSKTPGRTQQINLFRVSEQLVFADLPGYGFAKVPAEVQRRWATLVESYLVQRRELRSLVVIVDVRRGVEEDDRLLLHFLEETGKPWVLAVTKIDKVRRGERTRRQCAIRESLPEEATVCWVSARTGEGIVDLRRTIERQAAVA